MYSARARQVAEDLGIPYVDLWTGFLEAAGWKEGEPLIGSTTVPKNDRLGRLMPDGLHFSSEGNRLCYELVFKKIKEFYPDLDPEKMEAVVPMWDMAQDILAVLKEKLGSE
jgi:isoamyl acetate esterase